jgi:CBS domain-containing protein/ribosome-associated translation inhibitor RaiA
MQVSDVMIKDVITVSPDDTVAKALSLMIENNVHQLPVVEKNAYTGMIYAKHFIETNIFPKTTKVKNFVVKAPSLDPNVEIRDANQAIVRSGLRALPVIAKERLVGMVSETDLVLNTELGNMLVDDVMRGAIVIPGDSSLSNALAKMKRQNISRLPVINKDGKLIGNMDTLDIAAVLRVPKERKSGSRTTKLSSGTERTDPREVQVREIMHNAMPVERGSKLGDAVNVLKRAEEIIVTDNNMPIGIIAPKDIIKQLMPERGGPMIHISHVQDEGAKNEIVTEVTKFLKRMDSRFDRIYSVEVAVDRHKNRKYSMRGKLMTTDGLITAKSVGWDVRAAVKELMNRLDRRGTTSKSAKRGPSKAEYRSS